jgi:hypothetical protein
MKYEMTPADKVGVPPSYGTEPRYLGYRDEDRKRPYAHYFQDRSLPVQPHVMDALTAGPVSGAYGVRLSRLADDLSRPGYLPLETGYTVNDDGHLVMAILTDMPGVTGEMWDWWAWWHAVEPARYKLWHPDAHLYAAFTEDRSHVPGLSDRDRYVDNCCYINEYIGANIQTLRASFFDPGKLGFEPSKPGNTTLVARGGPSSMPLAITWLIHQVRQTPNGCEMRSRFISNHAQVLKQPPRSSTSTTGKILSLPGVNALAGLAMNGIKPQKMSEDCPAMVYHCAQEMNHLASFLPRLYEEFAADSRRL